MKTTKPSTFAIAIALFAVASHSPSANAEIIISNFALTQNSLSFDISGTLPNALPQNNHGTLFFVNPDAAADPGFALGGFIDATTASFVGTHSLRIDPLPVATGHDLFGDYFYIAFENDFAVGEAVSGSLAATWNDIAFDPFAASTLNVFWGTDVSLPLDPSNQPSLITGGIFLTSVSVPEPSAFCLVSLCGIAWMTRRRSR